MPRQPVDGDGITSDVDAIDAAASYGRAVTSLRFARIDIGVASAVAVVALVEVTANVAIVPKAAAASCEFAMAIALLWRRLAPLAAVTAVAVLQVVEAAAGVPLQQPVVPLLASVIAVYALMTATPAWQAATGAAIMLAAVGIETVVQDKGFGNFAFALVFIVGAGIVGRTVHSRTQHAVELADRAQTLERQQTLVAQLAVQGERTRIAREVHDIIAHTVSVMVVQAGAAEQIVRRDPDRALSAMRAVQTTGREALAEMARLLGMLREDSAEIGLTPTPGLADLTALVDNARRSGIDVHLQLDGYPRQLPAGPELSIYRIVQEALTNVRKHAGRSRASVHVTCSDTAIVAEIDNDGASEPLADPIVPGAGHGLIGMRERVALYGGTLSAGPSAAGGFQVRADIPLTGQP
jgi:signal transduction histidine kinase